MILDPYVFVKIFEHLPTPRVVFRGRLSGGLVDDIREGCFEVDEGIVAKGIVKGVVWMAKIKTNEYMKRLKIKHGSQWNNYWE